MSEKVKEVKWQVSDVGRAVHVLPLKDLCDHILTEECGYLPQVERHSKALIIHNSFDERERLETAKWQ